MQLRSFLVTLTAAALAQLPLAAATLIHVAPQGNDANSGTAESPLATPHAARDMVRRVISEGLREPVDIVFAEGTYPLGSTLELRPEDSGTAKFPITWRAAPGAKVVWSGGLVIPKRWTRNEDGHWQVNLHGIGPVEWSFRQLFVDGKRAIRARFPNVDAPNPFLYATGGDTDHLIIDPALVKECWGGAADAQINIVPESRFFNQWNTVTAVNTSTGRIDIADSERHRTINSGSWFWIEGVKEELDQPGEWYFDTKSRCLHSIPQTGADPNKQKIVSPFHNRLVNDNSDLHPGPPFKLPDLNSNRVPPRNSPHNAHEGALPTTASATVSATATVWAAAVSAPAVWHGRRARPKGQVHGPAP